MSYLVDTNILSDLSPAKRSAHATLRAWFEAHERDLFLSAVTVAEVEYGVALLRNKGATAKAGAIAQWLDAIVELYAERILAFDIAVAREAGRLLAAAQAKGGSPGFEDAAIAATAVRHGLTVVTRNARHFAPMSVAYVDPIGG